MRHFWLIGLVLAFSWQLRAAEPETGFAQIFDGKTMQGWKVSEKPESFKIIDGALVAKGPRAHAFYVGDERPFVNFELRLDVLTRKNSNGGVYFHTRYQETGWPKFGFECQVNNTFAKDPRKTASLYGVKDVLEAPAKDDEFWEYAIIVKGKTVTLKVNGKTVNEYVEPDDAKAGADFTRKLDKGTFALQAHDPGSEVHYKNIRVKRLD